MQVACEELKTDAEGLLRAIGDDAALLLLSQEVLEAACRTSDEYKVELLARIWAHGLDDDATPESDREMVAALAELEKPHAQILDLLAKEEGTGPVSEVSGKEKLMVIEAIGEHLVHLSSDILPAYIAKLDRLGMLQTPTSWNGNALFGLSSWGRLMVGYLDQWAATESVDDESDDLNA